MKDWTKKKKTGLRHPGWVALFVSPWVFHNSFFLISWFFVCLSLSFMEGYCFCIFFSLLCLLCFIYHVFIENNLSQSVMKSMWFLTLSAVWATSNHAFINVSAYFYWVQWFFSLPEKVRSYWTFRYFKVNHFETVEINICRWLNKLFIACVCVRQIVMWQMLTGLQITFQGFNSVSFSHSGSFSGSFTWRFMMKV